MISYFPRVYEDELLYSIVARYHAYTGNLALKTTLFEIYGDINKIATVEFPCDIEKIVNKLPENLGLNVEEIVLNNTAFPYYAPFLPKIRAMKIKKALISGSGKGIKTLIGFVAGSICKKEELMICYQCALEEVNYYGEAYFHRTHQLQGVYVCEKHKCYLQQYPKSSYSRLKFIRLDLDGFKPTSNIENLIELEQLIKIATAVKQLLQNDLNSFNQDEIHNKYIALLNDKGYVTAKQHVRQRILYEDFKGYYSNELLDKLESNISCNSQINWLTLITRKPKIVSHPLRHILLMIFLCGSVEQFINNSYKVIEKKSYPCLNPVSSHYREYVITNVVITADYKTREPIGTFECDCGFKYSRRMDADEFKVGRIKEFGTLWEEKLRSILLGPKCTLRQIANDMKCDCKTVVKYADLLELRYLLNSNMKLNDSKNHSIESNIKDLQVIYKEEVLKQIKKNPLLNRTDLRVKLKKQYIFLYRHEKEWLYKNLPSKQDRITIINRNNNWMIKDNDILIRLKQEHESMIHDESRPRITISLLGRKIGKLADLQKNINKLPYSREYLMTICETVVDYQIYRVNKVCKELIESDEIVKEWKVLRLAGLRNTINVEVYKRIGYYIN